jgi:hypothetical protein
MEKKTYLSVIQTGESSFSQTLNNHKVRFDFIVGKVDHVKCVMPRRVALQLMPASVLILQTTMLSHNSRSQLIFVFPSSPYTLDNSDRNAVESLAIFKELLGDEAGFKAACRIVASKSVSSADIDFYGVPYNQLTAKFDYLCEKVTQILNSRKIKAD